MVFEAAGMNVSYLRQIFQVGIPAGIQSVVINFSNAMLQSSVNSFGSTAMAGYTAANNLLGFLYASVNLSPRPHELHQPELWRGKFKRMDRVLIDCAIISVVFAGTLGTIFYVFGSEILQIYTKDPDVIKAGMEIISITTNSLFSVRYHGSVPGRHARYGTVGCTDDFVNYRNGWNQNCLDLWHFSVTRSLFVLFISYPGSWLITIAMQVLCFFIVRKQARECYV